MNRVEISGFTFDNLFYNINLIGSEIIVLINWNLIRSKNVIRIYYCNPFIGVFICFFMGGRKALLIMGGRRALFYFVA